MSRKKGSKKLDLGLTELLLAGGGIGIAPQMDNHDRPETSIIEFEDGVEWLRPELAKLAESGQWDALVTRTETAVITEDDIELRLWWVRGQLGAFSLPVSLVAAPFEAVCRSLVGDERLDQYKSLLREIGSIIVGRLRDVGDRRQEHSVRRVLSQLGVVFDGSSDGHFSDDNRVSLEATRVLHGDRVRETPSSESIVKPRPPRAGVMARAVWLLLMGVVCMACLLLVGGASLFSLNPRLVAVREQFVISTPLPELLPPLVEPRQISSHLEVLYHSITSLQKDQDAMLLKDRPSDVPPSDGRYQQPDGVSRPPAPVLPRNKEQINTDGPIEGPDFRQGAQRPRLPLPRLPNSGPEAVARPIPQASYPDGSLNIGGEIKSALVETKVYVSPHYRARVIANLLAGDQVLVEARLGQWLRIRSRQGRVGFVSAQDIGEREDFHVAAPPFN